MPLTLSSDNQRRIAEALRVLSSPLAYGSEAEWKTQAAESARMAVEAGTAVFIMTDAHGLDAAVVNVEPDKLAEYEQYFSVLERHGVIARGVRMGVGTRRALYGAAYSEMMRTDYTQDFLPSIRSYDGLSLLASTVSRPRSLADAVHLTLSATERGQQISEKQAGIGRLLYPGFVAGLGAREAMRGTRARLRSTLDITGAACYVADRSGRHVHTTPALDALCAYEPQSEALLALADRVAGAYWTEAPMPRSSFTGCTGIYTVSATEIHDGNEAYCVAIVSSRALRQRPLAGNVQARFGLTPRQAQVAQLLAERRTNKEIAAALAISGHTARHHVEAVLAQLGVSRSDVGTALTE